MRKKYNPKLIDPDTVEPLPLRKPKGITYGLKYVVSFIEIVSRKQKNLYRKC
jgi:hypothetical protein